MGVKKEINWDLIELYVKAGCTQQNICQAFYIHDDTLRDRVREKYGVEWSAFSAALHSEGKLLIEAQQFQKAMKGYWPALQWLGKVKLGQREPEMLNQLAHNQVHLDQSHRIMELEHQIEELKANADKSKTE
jgi:hypothetical protein